MKSSLYRGLVLASSALLMTACTNSGGGSSSTSLSSALSESPSSLIDAADGALSSLGSGFNSSFVSSGFKTLAATPSTDAKCDINGRPYDSVTNDRMESNNNEFAPTQFYCMFSANIGSPDTLRGALQQFKSIFCSIEAAIGTISYAEAGNDMISSPKEVALTSQCWPQGLPDGISPVILTDLVATKLNSSTTGWQYKLVFDVQGLGTKTIYFFLDQENNRYGFKTVDEGAAPGSGGATSITVDMANGVLLMNSIDDRNGAGGANSQYRRITRGRITGEFNSSTNRFSAIDKIEGYFMEGQNTFDASSISNSIFGVTVQGNSLSGYKYVVAQHDGNSTPNNQAPVCIGGSCDDVTALEITDKDFFNVTTDWASFITSSKPLCDDGNSVTLDPTPSVGPLGACIN